jgi:alpha-ketoglutarate-dependent taurine dioxygenase
MSAADIRPAEHASAWKAADIGHREGLLHRLGPEHLDAFRGHLAATRGRPVAESGPAAFASPVLDDLMAAVRDTLERGRGAVVLSGLDISGMPLEDFERIYWRLGSHLGRPAAQSAKGDLIGYVRHVTDSRARGYLTDMELGPHTDYHETMALACVRAASEGGLSGVSSALAVHNHLLAARPDLLEALYEGYYNGIPYRYGVADDPHSARKVPVFSRTGGQVSVFTLSFFPDAAAQRGEPVPPKFLEAMEQLREIAASDTFQVRFMLQPGEMMFWNNRVIFHSRTRFHNAAGVERLLLRLWLDPLGAGRPLHPEVAAVTEMVAKFHAQKLDQRELVTG